MDQNIDNHLERTVLSLPKLNDWSQDIDPSLASPDQPPPPRIPPHLLNILLNHELPSHVGIHHRPRPLFDLFFHCF